MLELEWHALGDGTVRWDEFEAIEERWSGMRCEIERIIVVSEQLRRRPAGALAAHACADTTPGVL